MACLAPPRPEYWAASDRGPAANDESVLLGVAHTGRVITAAALIMVIAFSALMAAQVSFMRLFGVQLVGATRIGPAARPPRLTPGVSQPGTLIRWVPTTDSSRSACSDGEPGSAV